MNVDETHNGDHRSHIEFRHGAEPQPQPPEDTMTAAQVQELKDHLTEMFKPIHEVMTRINAEFAEQDARRAKWDETGGGAAGEPQQQLETGAADALTTADIASLTTAQVAALTTTQTGQKS